MQSSSASAIFDSWIARLEDARAGSSDALGELLEDLRSHLAKLAQCEMDSDIRGKEGISDLVQGTLLEAARDFDRFRGKSEPELRGWLKNILINNLRDLLGKYLSQKRQVSREVLLADEDDGGTAAASESPSDIAVHKEQVAALHSALAKLSEEQREVVSLRYEENLAFSEIAARLGITEAAAQKRWSRSIEELRSLTEH